MKRKDETYSTETNGFPTGAQLLPTYLPLPFEEIICGCFGFGYYDSIKDHTTLKSI